MRKLFSLLAAVLFAGSMMAVEIYKNEGADGTADGITVTGNVNTTSSNGNPGNSLAMTSEAKKIITMEGFDVADYSNLKLTLDAAFKNFPSVVEEWPYVTVEFYKNGTLVQSDNETIKWSAKGGTYAEYVINISKAFDKIVFTNSPAKGKTGKGAAATNYGAYLDNIVLTGDLAANADISCQVSDDDDLSSFTYAYLFTEPYEDEGEVYYILFTNSDWKGSDFIAEIDKEAPKMPSSGAAFVIGFTPESLKNFTGEYDIDDNNLVMMVYQYDKTTNQWNFAEIEEGMIEITVGEDGDSYDMEYLFTVEDTDAAGTMYGLCADEIDVQHPLDAQEDDFDYKDFVYDPENDIDVEGDDEVGYDIISVAVQDEDEIYGIRLSFILLHSENPQLVAGTYPIKSVQGVLDLENQIVAAGYYADDDISNFDMRHLMFSIALYSSEIDNDLFYLVSGNVVVDNTGTITVNAKNSFDQDIKAKLVKKQATGLQNAELDNAPMKAIENGQFIIRKNGARFNALGAQLR